MNDESLKSLLPSAYPAGEATDDRMAEIGRLVRVRAAKARLRRRAIGVACIAVGLLAAVGFTYPIAAANLFEYRIRENMASAEPYRMTLMVLPSKGIGKPSDPNPTRIIVDKDAEYILDFAPGSKTFGVIDSAKALHVIHPAAKVEIDYPANVNEDAFYRLPITIMDSLAKKGKIDLSARIENLGRKVIDGRPNQEVAMTQSGKRVFIAEVDEENQVLTSMAIPTMTLKGQSFPSLDIGLRFDYSYDKKWIKNEMERLKPLLTGNRRLALDRDRPEIRREVLAKPLAILRTGRDRVRLYQVQEDPAGNVFVLYSCEGYHSYEGREGDWLILKDRTGKPWLSTSISMSFSDLAPKQEGLKAEFFANPTPGIHAGEANLSIRCREWEFVGTTDRYDIPDHTVPIGRFTPTPVDCVPIWYFYAFGIRDENWVSYMAQKLRIKNALVQKQWKQAIDLGESFNRAFPGDVSELWYTQADLDRDLAKAYRGAGNVAAARRYEDLAVKIDKG